MTDHQFEQLDIENTTELSEDASEAAQKAIEEIGDALSAFLPKLDNVKLPDIALVSEKQADPITNDRQAKEALDGAFMNALQGELDAYAIHDLVEYFGDRTDVIAKINQRLEDEGSPLRLSQSGPIERPGAEGNPDVSWRGYTYALKDTQNGKMFDKTTVWRA